MIPSFFKKYKCNSRGIFFKLFNLFELKVHMPFQFVGHRPVLLQNKSKIKRKGSVEAYLIVHKLNNLKFQQKYCMKHFVRHWKKSDFFVIWSPLFKLLSHVHWKGKKFFGIIGGKYGIQLPHWEATPIKDKVYAPRIKNPQISLVMEEQFMGSHE